jgi:hypothetical protein
VDPKLRSKNAERAEPSRVHASNVSPAEGEGRDAGAPIGRCFEETPAGDARGGAAARFQGLLPVTATPLKTRPPRGEATRAALSGPLRERTDDHRTD